MKWALNEVVDCCERALADQKSGSKERSILSLATKNAKRALKGGRATAKSDVLDVNTRSVLQGGTPRDVPAGPPVAPTTVLPATPEKTFAEECGQTSHSVSNPAPSSTDTHGMGTPQPLSEPSLLHSRNPDEVREASSSQTDFIASPEQFATSEDELNCLAYAASIAIVGESGSNYGAISRSSSKALASALELAVLLLNNPLIPTDFSCPKPCFEFSKKDTLNGAQVFFSKLLGGGSQGAAKMRTRAWSESANAEPSRNVRLLLVDAVLAASDLVRSKDTTDKLWFVCLAALSAAVVPQKSRARVCDVALDQMRLDCLCLHEERLVRVMEFLFGTLALPDATLILIEATRNVIQRVSKALPNFLERRGTLTCEAELLVGAANSPLAPVVAPDSSQCENADEALHSTLSGHGNASSHSSTHVCTNTGIVDMQRVLRLCSSIVVNAPVTGVTVVGPTAAAAGTLTTAALAVDGGDGGRIGVNYTASQSYAAVTTALGVLLSCVVNGGPTFRRSDVIAQVIRQSVLPATMRSSLSPDIDLFRLSLNVILYSCFRFSAALVSETATVFRHVYFRVLGSKFAALSQKLLVLDVFQKYIEEPQNLIGLFLNYDCNTYSQSVYEEMIHYLAALAFPWSMRQAATNVNPVIKDLFSSLAVKLEYDVDTSLRQRAMEQLVMVADSNIQWIERFEDDSAVVTASVNSAEQGRIGDTSGEPLRMNMSAIIDDTSDALPASVSSSQDTFLQARRYKDAFKKFCDMFNEKGSPESAIEFLRNSVLFEGLASTSVLREGVVTESAVDANESNITVATPLTDAVMPTENEQAAHHSGSNPLSVPPVSVESDPTAMLESCATPQPSHESAATAAETTDQQMRRRTSCDSVDEVVEDAAVADAHKVAVFLRRNEDYLDKLALGDYFAKSFRKLNTRLVFEEWIKLHNFAGLSLDEALRLFLGGFKLLGEAQVVDKTMELFAAQYCRQNPTVFRAADTAFILSFSICMLNTDAHSTHIKEKMSLEGFIKNNAGIDDGMDVSPDILSGIYQRIVHEEIVLRPSPRCPSFNARTHSIGDNGHHPGGGQRKVATNLLRSVPILRNLIPFASAITDKVSLPIDMFNSAERKREELYQAELTSALKEIMTMVPASNPGQLDNDNRVHLVMASRIEHAILMWEVTVSPVCNLLIASLVRLCEDAEAYTPLTLLTSAEGVASGHTGASGGGPSATGLTTASASPIVAASASLGVPSAAFAATAGVGAALSATAGGASNAASALTPSARAGSFLKENPTQAQFMGVLLRGLNSVMKVCCSFGNVMHTEMMVEHCFELTWLSRTVVCSGQPAPCVTVTQTLSAPRLALIAALLNVFLSHGTSLTASSWQFCYSALSLLDATANGIDGVFRRKSKKLLQSTATTATASADGSSSLLPPGNGKAQPPPDMWFGNLSEVPNSVSRASVTNRQSLLSGLRRAPGSMVDRWLEQLFDATQYPFATQVHMANGLAPVAAKELQTERVFSLTKLFDFVSSCASLSSRLQWRELWSHARAVFVMAGCMKDPIANSTLDGLRIVALTYLMREELFNYSFQKEVMKPFEDILMSNQSVSVRTHIITIVSELIEFRASRLASGWSVVFSCLSHAAVIPEIVSAAWEACEKVITTQLVQVKDYFSDFVFCLTTFACTNMEESIALKGISYLVACGHWMSYGLETPPADIRTATEVVLWACRYGCADAEVEASHSGGRHLPRVTVAAEPITSHNPLKKPSSYTVKTAYQLWMSLFEGLVPVVVVQASVRARAHAIHCIWSLVKVYGGAFNADVQESLFAGMLQPMLTTVTNHLPAPRAAGGSAPAVAEPQSCATSSEATASSSQEVDQLEYSIVTGIAFHGMLTACLHHPHLLDCACATLLHFCSDVQVTRAMMMNGLVGSLLGVVIDFFSSSCTRDTLDFFWSPVARHEHADAQGEYMTSTCEDHRDLCTAANPYSPAGVAGRRCFGACSAFAATTWREVLELGCLDVTRLEHTAEWTELHKSPVARRGAVALAGLCPTLPEAAHTQAREALRHTAARAGTALFKQVLTRLNAWRAERETCLVASRNARRCLLAMSFFAVVAPTDDVFLQLVLSSALGQTTQLLTDAPVLPVSDTDRGTATLDTDSIPPVEVLLLVPYAVGMLSFIVECYEIQADAPGGAACRFVSSGQRSHVEELMMNVSQSLATDLKVSRQYCLDAQHLVQKCVAEEAATPGCGVVKGKTFKSYKGKSFMDTFRAARAPISERVRHFSYDSAPAELLQRILYEWRYLLDVVALKFVLDRYLTRAHLRTTVLPTSEKTQLTTSPAPPSTFDLSEALALLPCFPSELEESAAELFFRSCWNELALNMTPPSDALVTLLVQVVDLNLRAAQEQLRVRPSVTQPVGSDAVRAEIGYLADAPQVDERTAQPLLTGNAQEPQAMPSKDTAFPTPSSSIHSEPDAAPMLIGEPTDADVDVHFRDTSYATQQPSYYDS